VTVQMDRVAAQVTLAADSEFDLDITLLQLADRHRLRRRYGSRNDNHCQ
jgi:hypothetical protein